MNNGDKVIVGKPGDDWRVHDPKYALFLTPTDDEASRGKQSATNCRQTLP